MINDQNKYSIQLFESFFQRNSFGVQNETKERGGEGL